MRPARAGELLHLCPACRCRFEKAGFCPFDGSSLVLAAIVDQPTLVSGHKLAQVTDRSPGSASAADDTSIAGKPGHAPDVPTMPEVRRRTFPLTPVPMPGTGELTASRTRPGLVPSAAQRARPASDPPKIVSRSASDNPHDALAVLGAPQPNEYDRLVGQTLDGRYYIENKIGEGGMGVVFSARHAVIERPLAIKVLKRDAMRDTATIRRFVQEAKAASRIGHPNIVDVTDFGTTPDGMTYSVMELVPGKTLGVAMRHDAPFTALRALRITAQIARALGAAHDKGIVHRDLKPENVFLLDRDGRQDFVKIVDFGIAKVTPPSGVVAEPRLTRAGSVFGTPEYMAPEQAAGRGDTDHRVDIYALGVLLYEMICGQVPHRGDSMVRTLAMQMLDPIEPPSQVRPDLAIAPDLEAVVMRALAKRREQRYQTMSDLLAALEAIMPPVVGQSVTGSPVYTLAALPPGADPGVVPALPARPLSSSEAARAEPRTPAPRAGEPPPPSSPTGPTARRIKDEPEFTADDRPVSFEHVFTDGGSPVRGRDGGAGAARQPSGGMTDEPMPIYHRRWPLLVLLALISGAAAGAITLVVKSRRDVAADDTGDARIALAAVDAGAPLMPGDTEPPIDAAGVVVLPELDAGRTGHPPAPPARSDASLPETPNHRGTIVVQVLTKPEDASLYDEDQHYRGPGGAQLEEVFGKRRVISCKQPGYKPGSVEVMFDGGTTAVLCTLQRIKLCINNIKNPFDDCELDPGAPAHQP